jgi:hypothetical protein
MPGPIRTIHVTVPPSLRGLRSVLARRAARRRMRARPGRDWAVSAALLAGAFALGASCLPSRLVARPDALAFADPGGGGVVAAVFALRPDGSATRFGQAQSADGVIRVGLYDRSDKLLAHATEAVAMPADLRLAWLTAPEAERAAIAGAARATARHVADGARDALGSPEFAAAHRDRLVAIGRTAAGAAWEAARGGAAWRELAGGVDPAVRAAFDRDARPALERQFHAVPAQLLRANALALVDPFTDRPWNLAPVEAAVRAAFAELRARGAIESMLAQAVASPAAQAFARDLQEALSRELLGSSELRAALGDIALDPALRAYFAPAIESAEALGRRAPRLLMGTPGGELNLIAATAIRATIAGRGERAVVFMSAAQRDAVSANALAQVQALERQP